MKLDGKRMRYARYRLGCSLDMVGERSGISKNTARRAERGEEVRPSTARKIAAGLRLEVADLVPNGTPNGYAPSGAPNGSE